MKNAEIFVIRFSNLGNLKWRPAHSKTIPATPHASWKLPGSFLGIFEKSQLFMKISTFSVSQKNLSFDPAFSQTHRQTQQIHSWIAHGLRKRTKLVSCKTNTGILSYGHFSGQKIRKIQSHSWRNLSLQPNYSKSREGSTSHVPIVLVHSWSELGARGKPSTMFTARDDS